jgi:ABC-type lipoprotein release transport system permease subunit
VSQGVVLALAGTAVGLAVCLLAAPVVQPLLFHVAGRDPVVFATVGVVLLAVAALASLGPGLRTTRVDPAEALRIE